MSRAQTRGFSFLMASIFSWQADGEIGKTTKKLKLQQLTWLQSLSVAQAHEAGVVHLGLHGNHR